MIGIKKIDLYILRKFLPLFAAAFFICLFVFMMQFTWRYVEELVGKGLSLDILAQFFWYMGITMVPMALPPAVLLASLITFGNMGEQLELLSMKAAGVPLIRIMRPVLFIVLPLTVLSFVFLMEDHIHRIMLYNDVFDSRLEYDVEHREYVVRSP